MPCKPSDGRWTVFTVRTPAIGFDLEARLKAMTPLAARAADRIIPVMLMGGMGSFQWGIVGGRPLTARRGERVHIVMQNHGMMAHPVHLHGHCFPVIGINSWPVSGAVRDTVHVPPMTSGRLRSTIPASGRFTPTTEPPDARGRHEPTERLEEEYRS